MTTVLVQQRLEYSSVVVRGVVEHDDHAPARASMTQQAAYESLKRLTIEARTERRDQAARTQVHGTKAGDGLARRRVLHDGIPALRSNPHAATRSVLLEVAFVDAPQINVVALCQAAQFFLQRIPPVGRTVRLAVAACASENPFV